MKANDPFDGFTVNIFQDEEGDYLAHFVELPNISAFADSPELAIKELVTAWEGVKQSYIQQSESVPKAPNRKEFSELLQIRMKRSLHRVLAKEAEHAGVSLGELVSERLAKSA